MTRIKRHRSICFTTETVLIPQCHSYKRAHNERCRLTVLVRSMKRNETNFLAATRPGMMTSSQVGGSLSQERATTALKLIAVIFCANGSGWTTRRDCIMSLTFHKRLCAAECSYGQRQRYPIFPPHQTY